MRVYSDFTSLYTKYRIMLLRNLDLDTKLVAFGCRVELNIVLQ